MYQSLQSLRGMPRVNVDEILREFGNWRNTADVMTAGKIAVKMIARYFEEDITFNQETTLCGQSILKNVKRAKEKGYFIELHYIGVDTVEIAKKRVLERIRLGGHGVSEKDIERRYIETFRNLKIVLPDSDLAALYDNTSEFRRFAIYKNGTPERISQNVPIWYKRFMDDVCREMRN